MMVKVLNILLSITITLFVVTIIRVERAKRPVIVQCEGFRLTPEEYARYLATYTIDKKFKKEKLRFDSANIKISEYIEFRQRAIDDMASTLEDRIVPVLN